MCPTISLEGLRLGLILSVGTGDPRAEKRTRFLLYTGRSVDHSTAMFVTKKQMTSTQFLNSLMFAFLNYMFAWRLSGERVPDLLDILGG
jgi:hypothetical protein